MKGTVRKHDPSKDGRAAAPGPDEAQGVAKAGPEPAPPAAEKGSAPQSLNQRGRNHQRSALWGWVVLVATILLFLFGVGFLYRLFRPGDEFWGFSANVAQLVSLIALLGLQTEQGREQFKTMSWRWAALGLLLMAIVVVVFIWGPRPAAYQLNVVGVEALDRGNLATALERFQAAVGLDPRNAKAHFNLGDAYEATGDFEQAIVQYRRALELDDKLAPAYNNLGRLYLRDRRDTGSALEVLLAGLANTEDPLVRAVLRKNIGWAYLEKGLFTTALAELDRADEELTAQPNVMLYQAEVDRLKALAYGAHGEQGQAKASWTDCLGHAQAIVESDTCQQVTGRASADCINAQVWAAEARERMESLEGRP